MTSDSPECVTTRVQKEDLLLDGEYVGLGLVSKGASKCNVRAQFHRAAKHTNLLSMEFLP